VYQPLAYQQVEDSDQECYVCLDLLTPKAEFISKAVDRVRQAGFEFSSFKLQVSLPPVVYFRDACAKSSHSLKVVDVKDAFKWLYAPILAAELNSNFDADSGFVVSLVYEADNNDAELSQLNLKAAKKRGHKTVKTSRVSINSVVKALSQMSQEHLEALKHTWQVQPQVLSVEVEVSAAPIYVMGNYLKLSRNFSQSPWSLEDRKEFEGNVEDILAGPLKEAYQARGHTFYSSVKCT
jgi:tRNA pseudouridine synthase 10